ncbi:hypothetical protein [Aeromicrobium sp.]|uniref:hypothetical protein n=1 Tax=Aeromicrobium sp. TaxID=1871063 RepID=UPI003C4450D4
MTTIQNFHAPSFHVSSKIIRMVAVAAVAAAALVAFAVPTSSPFTAFLDLVDWAASHYFIVLIASVVSVAALGGRANAIESNKPQYDIR